MATAPEYLFRDSELLFVEKYGWFGVCMPGDEAPIGIVIDSNDEAGIVVLARSRCSRGRSVGGFGAGPGFMNWSRE